MDEYNAARLKAADYYSSKLDGINGVETPKINTCSSHVFHQYTLKLSPDINRDELQKYLSEKEIPSMVYYPVPLHHQKAYLNEDVSDQDYPVTMDLINSVISLPMHTELTFEQQDFIIESIIEYLNK